MCTHIRMCTYIRGVFSDVHSYNECARRCARVGVSTSPLNNAIAGMGGGICEAVCAVTPVETVKTRVTDDQRRGTGPPRHAEHSIACALI